MCVSDYALGYYPFGRHGPREDLWTQNFGLRWITEGITQVSDSPLGSACWGFMSLLRMFPIHAAVVAMTPITRACDSCTIAIGIGWEGEGEGEGEGPRALASRSHHYSYYTGPHSVSSVGTPQHFSVLMHTCH